MDSSRRATEPSSAVVEPAAALEALGEPIGVHMCHPENEHGDDDHHGEPSRVRLFALRSGGHRGHHDDRSVDGSRRSCRGSRRPVDLFDHVSSTRFCPLPRPRVGGVVRALALETGAARPRRRDCDRRHLRLPPTDDRRLPRRLARRTERVLGVDGGARGGHSGQHSDVRAAVAGASPRPPLLGGADDDPGDHRALDRGTGRRGGRDRDRLRDVAALGLPAALPLLAR